MDILNIVFGFGILLLMYLGIPIIFWFRKIQKNNGHYGIEEKIKFSLSFVSGVLFWTERFWDR